MLCPGPSYQCPGWQSLRPLTTPEGKLSTSQHHQDPPWVSPHLLCVRGPWGRLGCWIILATKPLLAAEISDSLNMPHENATGPAALRDPHLPVEPHWVCDSVSPWLRDVSRLVEAWLGWYLLGPLPRVPCNVPSLIRHPRDTGLLSLLPAVHMACCRGAQTKPATARWGPPASHGSGESAGWPG